MLGYFHLSWRGQTGQTEIISSLAHCLQNKVQSNQAIITQALVQFRPPANFSVKNRQILNIGKTCTLGFSYMLNPNMSSVFQSEAYIRHFYQDYVNFTKNPKSDTRAHKSMPDDIHTRCMDVRFWSFFLGGDGYQIWEFLVRLT